MDVYFANELHSKHTTRPYGNHLNNPSTLHYAQCTCTSRHENKHGPIQRSHHGLCRSKFELPCRQKIFSTSHPSRPSPGPTKPLVQQVTAIFLGCKAAVGVGGCLWPPTPHPALWLEMGTATPPPTPPPCIMEYYGDTYHSFNRLILVYKCFLWPFNRIPALFRRISAPKFVWAMQEFTDEVNAWHNNRTMNWRHW